MDAFSRFLDANLNRRAPVGASEKYRDGIVDVAFLEETDPLMFDGIARARFLYVRNLSLREPVCFDVPDGLSPSERALMFLSFGDFARASCVLGLSLRCEVVGAEIAGRTGATSNTLVLRLENTASSELHDFRYESQEFKNFQVEPLNRVELVFLYVKARELLACDEERELVKFRLTAFVSRALFEKNELDDALKTAFLLLKTEVSNDVCELEKYNEVPINLSADIFGSPITFKSARDIQIGVSLMRSHDYSAAYDILQSYPVFDEKIDCLIAMKRSDAAAFEIEQQIRVLLHTDDRIKLSGLYIKLGHLYQDVKYFDMAASVYRSARPLRLKGLWFFNRKLFSEAAEAFEQALGITPNSEEIRFSYGCALVQLDRIAEALKVFRILKSENPQNENISKNLSYCYYKLDDVDKMLDTLKSVAVHYHPSMKQYLYISIKNDRFANVKWGLQRMNYDAGVRDMVQYLVYHGKMEEGELRGILEGNHYFNSDQVYAIFTS